MSMDDIGGVTSSSSPTTTTKISTAETNGAAKPQENDTNEEQFDLISPSVNNNHGIATSTTATTIVKPRTVSFNRDVHVKRIELRESPDVVPALTGVVGPGLGQSNEKENTSGTRLFALPVRREKLGHLSRKQLAEEAAKVLKQADSVHCVSNRTGSFPEKFYSLPSRKKNNRYYQNESPNSSTERKLTRRRRSEELGSTTSIILPEAPKKPPRTFLTRSVSDVSAKNSNKNSQKDQPARPKRSKKNPLKNLFKKTTKVKRSKSDVSDDKNKKQTNINRSHSDVSDKKPVLRKRSGSLTDENLILSSKKSQLSPIIEASPNVEHSSLRSPDYFSVKPVTSTPVSSSDKENQQPASNNIELIKPPERKKWKKQSPEIKSNDPPSWQKDQPQSIVIIDVDNAETLTSRKNPLRKSFEDRLKSITKRNKKKEDIDEVDNKNSIQKLKEKFEEEILKQSSPEMIHSSQKPVDRLPLTRGHTVDHMVKRLSHEQTRFSPPPKTPNVLITPKIGINHNNNLPFSYTKPSVSPISDTELNNRRNSLSPEREYQSSYQYETRSPVYSPKNDKTPNGQIIYAQVVCGTPESKQTIHRTYDQKTKLFTPNSDSDEGLGYEEYGKNRLESKNNSFNDDLPISPKYNQNGGFTTTKREYTSNFMDTTILRGRADGMDTVKRRESLTELLNNDNSKINERNDLSSRRELLESRINSRNKLFETKSKYLKNGSSPPLTNGTGYVEKFTSESYLDEHGDRVTNETHTTEKIIGNNRFTENYQNNKIIKEFHKSNPELIAQKRYEDVLERRNHRTVENTSYHDSLKRNKANKYDVQVTKDKFVDDSGIENDFRRDSERRNHHNQRHRNDSEDEGFQSSLLIAVEKQHTEDNHRKYITNEYHHQNYHHKTTITPYTNGRKDYDDSDIGLRDLDDSDRDIPKYKTETLQRNHKKQTEYVPRERSIDDGSHYDPRIDKDLDKNGKKIDTKPPKGEKKISSLDKVKNLFSSKKTKEKRAAKAVNDQLMVDEQEMRARYSEYKGSKENLDNKQEVDYSKRKKLTTPRSSRSPTPERLTNTLTRSSKHQQLNKQQSPPPASNSSNNWFKSLDRITRKNKKSNLVVQSDISKISETEVSDPDSTSPQKPQKNLRFFGDTDAESNNDSIRQKGTSYKQRSSLNHNNTSTLTRTSPHRNLTDIDEQIVDRKDKTKLSGKPPVSPYEPRILRGHSRNGHTSDTLDGRRRAGSDSTLKRLKRNDSLLESSEGDSSQQSQRSVVYLHAATVGDIPGPGDFARRRGASREELSSIASSRVVTPQVKTLSRSFSVLAPWKPRHYRESYNIDYSQQPVQPRSKSSTSTVKSKIDAKNSRNGTSSTLNRRSKSKDNVSTLSRKSQSRDNVSKSKDDISSNRSTSTLNRKSKSTEFNERKSRSKDNLASSTLNRRAKDGSDGSMYKKNEKTASSRDNKKSMSLESLGSNRRNSSSDKEKEKRDRVSRSVSMPKEKSAGWFSKKSSKK